MNNVNDTTKYWDILGKYSDVLFTFDEDGKTIKEYTIDESSGFGKFAKAEGYASTGISILSTTLEDIMGFIELDSKLKAYQENKDFLNEVIRSKEYDCRRVKRAWNFYYTYHTLYQIRQKGEESYLAMCNVKGLAAGLAKKGIHYKLKEEVVNSILKILEERCQFALPEGMEIPKSASYHSKFVVQCPVDLEVLDSSGNVVVRLSDQIESDVTNRYGRFAVVYMPYTDDYAKVICLNHDSGCFIRAIGTDRGLVNLEMASKTDDGISNYKINNEPVSKDTIIHIDFTNSDVGQEELGYQKWESESPEEIENKTMESVSADKTEVAVSEINPVLYLIR